MTPNHLGQLDCASCRPLLDALLLDELAPESAQRVRAHIARCRACSAEFGGLTRLLEALALVPVPSPSDELDERIIRAAIAERQRRHEHRSWLRDLRTQVFRGAVRTTSTLAVTVVVVALIGASLVFAASSLLGNTSFLGGRGGTFVPEVTPTLTSPSAAPSPAAQPKPTVESVTPAPTAAPVTPAPTPRATPKPTPKPTATAEPTASPLPSATEQPTASPAPSVTPSPTPKPRRTPPPTASPSPTASPTSAPSADVTPSP